ncbi:IS6 family transposase [Streptomyces sp. NPDC048411]|uniref:IS6 family transposase n=1 Tax=Streptomyces sp. NPDC048411 TaxID=3157206 RepID=UPI003456D62F
MVEGAVRGERVPVVQGHRYPVEVISHCVWLYFRFPLSFREVEELMLQRGVVVSHETVRRWCAKFGQAYADGLRRRRPRPGDKWHLDEVFVKINGVRQYLWRAVDQDGNVLDILVQSRRDKAAARRFLRRLMKKTGAVPRVMVTDKLRSYGAAHREVMPSIEHRSHKGLNNRAENSHQPTRQRERAMKGFRSVGGAQRFLSAFSGISLHFRPRRHLITAAEHRLEMTIRFTIWDQITENISRAPLDETVTFVDGL